MAEEDIYNDLYVNELMDNDEITVQEAGLMFWYDQDNDRITLDLLESTDAN